MSIVFQHEQHRERTKISIAACTKTPHVGIENTGFRLYIQDEKSI
jgi:hypothetical protein